MAKGDIPPEIILLAEDLQFCIKLVLRQQITDISKGLTPTTLIDLGALSAREKKRSNPYRVGSNIWNSCFLIVC